MYRRIRLSFLFFRIFHGISYSYKILSPKRFHPSCAQAVLEYIRRNRLIEECAFCGTERVKGEEKTTLVIFKKENAFPFIDK